MKICLNNLGPIDKAEFSLGDFTVICGKNNTGKTYVTYVLYCFLDFWNNEYRLPIDKSIMDELFSNGSISLDLQKFITQANEILKRAAKEFSSPHIMARVFAADRERFEDTNISIELDVSRLKVLQQKNYEVNYSYGIKNKSFINISRNSNILDIKLLVDSKEIIDRNMMELVMSPISNTIKTLVFSSILPQPFISSAERTGSAIFQKELDFTTSKIVDILRDREKSKDFHPLDILQTYTSRYPIPVRKNVDFIRGLSSIEKQKSFIYESYPNILKLFGDIIGGSYKTEKKTSTIYYIPKYNKKLRLTIPESSSCARSLLDLGYYIRHVAKPNDLLMIDEPEMNLHPESQRKLARLLATLVNIGIKVYITTHSDYIVKEISTLIVLNQDVSYIKKIAEHAKYSKLELLNKESVRVYTTKCDKTRRGINPKRCGIYLEENSSSQEEGISVPNFDETINQISRMQNDIIFGE